MTDVYGAETAFVPLAMEICLSLSQEVQLITALDNKPFLEAIKANWCDAAASDWGCTWQLCRVFFLLLANIGLLQLNVPRARREKLINQSLCDYLFDLGPKCSAESVVPSVRYCGENLLSVKLSKSHISWTLLPHVPFLTLTPSPHHFSGPSKRLCNKTLKCGRTRLSVAPLSGPFSCGGL